MSAAVLLTSAATSVLLGANAPIVVLGPGSLDMRLLTAKLAAKSGFDTTLFAGQGAQQLWWEQMYGEEYIAGEQVEGRASLLSGNDEREAAEAREHVGRQITNNVATVHAQTVESWKLLRCLTVPY